MTAWLDFQLTFTLIAYHYLGFSETVGENMKYIIFDRQQRPLACILFGSTAWKVASRDDWSGGRPHIRQVNLPFITNNMRFLILPWVRVPQLASHLLANIALSHNNDSNLYAGGIERYSTNSGSTWNSETSRDLKFITYKN